MKVFTKFIFMFFVLTSCAFAQEGDKKKEADYVGKFCTGKQEVPTYDRLRVDCIQDGMAIEYDWASKWAECIGQSLEYGRSTGLIPACVLILRGNSDYRFVEKVEANVSHYNLPIRIYVVYWGAKTMLSWPLYIQDSASEEDTKDE